MELGFKSRGSASSSHASPARSKGKQSTTTSPQRSSSATPKKKASPARQQSPAKPQLSEAEKTRRLDRMCGEFKSLEREVVKMALEACQYEESKARTTLTRVASQWQSEGSSRERSTASASSNGSRGTSTQRPASPMALGAQASMEPVALSQDRPSPTRTTGGSTTTGRQTVSTRTIIGGSSSVTGKKTTTKAAAPKPQQQQQQRRAKHVTIVTTQGGQQDRDRVVTTQPRPQPHAATAAVPVHYGGSGLARGPDPTLHAGPDPDLRAGPEPGLYFGPNPELCDGPDPDLLQGASEAAEGPNPEYHQGKVPDLAGGSFGSAGPNPTLRCAAEYTSPIGMDQRYLQTTI